MKKILFMFFCLLALLPPTINYATDIKVDGNLIAFPDAKPFINKENRTLVPVRFITESIGAQVVWDESTQIVKIQKDNKIIVMKSGESQASIDGIVKKLDTRILIKDNRCFVPLRFILEETGLKVYWNYNTSSVDLITNSTAENHISGLILGLSKKGDNKYDYRTLWITQDKGNVDFMERKDSIIMPYKDSFFKIINKKYYKEYENFATSNNKLSVNYVMSIPVDANANKTDPISSSNGNMLFDEDRAGDQYHNSSNVLYAGNTLCCINESYIWTGRQGSGWERYSNKTYSSNSIIDNNKTINLLSLLDNKTKETIDDYSKKYNKKVRNNGWTYKQSISPNDICLARNKGKWNLALPVLWQMIEMNLCNNYQINEYVMLEEEIPSEFNQYNELGLEWDTIKEAIPEAVDAVTSPSNDVLIVQTDNELKVFINPLQGINEPIKTIPCSSNEKIVLNQWVTGKSDVSKWDNNLRK